MFATIMRYYSYLFQLVLCLFLLGISALALLGGGHNLDLDVLPWTGAELTYWLFFAGLVGLVSLALAAMGVFRLLFSLWSLAVFLMMVYGYFLSSFVFRDSSHFRNAMLLMLGALAAFYGSMVKPRAKSS